MIWLSISGSALKDEYDNVIGSVGLLTNITERKLAEEEIIEIKNRYQSLFENSLIGIGVATPEGKIIEANIVFADMLGYKLSELISIEVSNFYKNPNDRKSIVNILNQKNRLIDFETKLIRKDGVVIDVLLNVSLIKIKGKKFYQTSCQDITDRKQAEVALHQSESKYRLLAQNSGDVIFTFDFDLNYTYISPAIYALCGYRPKEIINRNLLETLTPASGKKVKQLFDKYIPAIKSGNASAEPLILELEVLKKDGTTICVEIKLSVLADSKGKPKGSLGVSRDISERKAMQEQLIKAKENAVTQFFLLPILKVLI